MHLASSMRAKRSVCLICGRSAARLDIVVAAAGRHVHLALDIHVVGSGANELSISLICATAGVSTINACGGSLRVNLRVVATVGILFPLEIVISAADHVEKK